MSCGVSLFDSFLYKAICLLEVLDYENIYEDIKLGTTGLN